MGENTNNLPKSNVKTNKATLDLVFSVFRGFLIHIPFEVLAATAKIRKDQTTILQFKYVFAVHLALHPCIDVHRGLRYVMGAIT